MTTKGSENKTITINIEGSGAIDVPVGADIPTVVRIVKDNLEPVLVGILQESKFVEGEEVHDF